MKLVDQLKEFTRSELQQLARTLELEGRSKLTRDGLIEAIARQRKAAEAAIRELVGMPPERAPAKPAADASPTDKRAAEKKPATSREKIIKTVESVTEVARSFGKRPATAAKPATKPAAKPAAKPTAKPSSKAETAPSNRSADHSAEKSAEKSAAKPADKATAKAAKKAPARNPALARRIETADDIAESAKYLAGESTDTDTPATLPNLPEGYGDDTLTLLVRDPRRVVALWDFSAKTLADAASRLVRPRMILRVHSWVVLGVPHYDPQVVPRDTFDVVVGGTVGNYYVALSEPGRSAFVELGFLDSDGTFIKLATSNIVDTPPEEASGIVYEEFATVPIVQPLDHFPVRLWRWLGRSRAAFAHWFKPQRGPDAQASTDVNAYPPAQIVTPRPASVLPSDARVDEIYAVLAEAATGTLEHVRVGSDEFLRWRENFALRSTPGGSSDQSPTFGSSDNRPVASSEHPTR